MAIDYLLKGSNAAELWSVIKAQVVRNLKLRRRDSFHSKRISGPQNPSSNISDSQPESHGSEGVSLALGQNIWNGGSSIPNSSLTCTKSFNLQEVVDDYFKLFDGSGSWIEVNEEGETKSSSAEESEKLFLRTETCSPIDRTIIDVRKNFRDALQKHLTSPNAEIEHHLEAEEDMRLFCRLFPHNHAFDRETMIQLWIARGFIKGEHKNRMANDFFEILLSAGYILRTGTCFATKKDMYRRNVDKLMSDSASIMCDKIVENNDSHVFKASNGDQHVSLVGDDIDEASLKALTREFKNLKALLLLCENASNINKIPQEVFFALKFLEVLHLGGTHITELPSSIGLLAELRYLDLSLTLIEVLPESVRNLSNLQSLKLNNCERLLRLPEATRMLTSLEHLELDVLSQLAMMPRGMGALTKLVTLSAFLINNDDGRSIEELKYMNSLKGRFCLARLENVSKPSEVKEAALSEKEFLELEFRWSDSHEAGDKGENDYEEILELLHPNSSLEQLKISCYSGKKFPQWISLPSLDMLTTIILFKCDKAEMLPTLGQLPSLKFLSLMEMNSVKQIGSEFWAINIPIAFPKLEKLEIIGFSRLESWKETKQGDFPQLSNLVIERCPKLIAVPSSLLQLDALKYLEILYCSALTSLLDKNLSTSLETLIVDDCALVTKEFQKWVAKDWLKIKHVQNVWINQEEITTLN